MMQHINLYDASLRKRESKLNARNVAYVTAFIFIALLLVSGVNGVRLYLHDSAVKQAENQLQQLKQSVAELNAKLPKMTRDDSLPAKFKKLERELEQKHVVLTVLSKRSLGNTDGFVEHLAGFARQHVEGLWLTNVRIEQGGTQLSLAGHALKPEYVPQYLKKLTNETVLQGTEFKSFLLVNEKKNANKVDFQITTQSSGNAALESSTTSVSKN